MMPGLGRSRDGRPSWPRTTPARRASSRMPSRAASLRPTIGSTPLTPFRCVMFSTCWRGSREPWEPIGRTISCRVLRSCRVSPTARAAFTTRPLALHHRVKTCCDWPSNRDLFWPTADPCDGSKKPAENGYHVVSLQNGDFLVTIRHDGCRNLVAEGDDPQVVIEDTGIHYDGDWSIEQSPQASGGACIERSIREPRPR